MSWKDNPHQPGTPEFNEWTKNYIHTKQYPGSDEYETAKVVADERIAKVKEQLKPSEATVKADAIYSEVAPEPESNDPVHWLLKAMKDLRDDLLKDFYNQQPLIDALKSARAKSALDPYLQKIVEPDWIVTFVGGPKDGESMQLSNKPERYLRFAKPMALKASYWKWDDPPTPMAPALEFEQYELIATNPIMRQGVYKVMA